MARRMQGVPFEYLLHWILKEFHYDKKIFGISKDKFFVKSNGNLIPFLNNEIDTPFGPAAGPHTQLAQNIISSYLVGGRFFELKTVQILDNLEIDKPCIDVEDERYNVEWSQELSLIESFDEYLKAWIILHLIKIAFGLSDNDERGFIFNMSVGYNLEGIKSSRMDDFIENIKDASKHPLFDKYLNRLKNFVKDKKELKSDYLNFDRIEKFLETHGISPFISNSVTLSTMHGCPSDEIETIVKYLIKEKGLHSFVKLNPTLLGYDFVRNVLDKSGYNYIELSKNSFEKDLKFTDAISLIERLQKFAKEHGKIFGIKLSNTLGVENFKQKLPGKEMYLSGRALFPLTINLAYKIAKEFDGNILISYSGGVSILNTQKILTTGIYPITFATDLLKPGSYYRLYQIVRDFENHFNEIDFYNGKIDLTALKDLADDSLKNKLYFKETREVDSIKLSKELPLFDCYIAPCQVTCPIEQDVAEYIYYASLGEFKKAFEVIIQKNPLPHITGYICDHKCETRCTRWNYDGAVLIREIKKFVTENAYSDYLKNFKRNQKEGLNKIKVAVIGAGPVGLATSYFLAKAGFEVTIFEKTDKAGGTVKHEIPSFRIPREVIDKDIEFIKMHGVKIIYNIEGISIDKLIQSGYKYVFIGIGAGIPKELEIEISKNEKEQIKIFDALSFLQRFNTNQKVLIGKRVAVIGGGNSAMDGARAAIRCEGVEKVYIIYRRTKEYMPADREEINAALEDGVEFLELFQPIKIEGRNLICQKMKLGEFDKDGRRKSIPIDDEFQTIELDTIITAIGEQPDYNFLLTNYIHLNSKNDLIVNPETNETTISNVYVGGDVLRGPATVVEAIADGKKVAKSIMAKEKIEMSFDLEDDISRKNGMSEKVTRSMEVIEYVKNDLIEEAARCLSCNVLCNKCVDVCPNRANNAIDLKHLFDDSDFGKYFKDRYQIIHIDSLCNECGNCETFCPYIGKPYKDKFTIFWDENEFEKSLSDGCLAFEDSGKVYLKIKFNNQIFDKVDIDNIDSMWNDKSYKGEMVKNLIRIIQKDYDYLIKK